MKKSVVILIMIIYIASIALVSFFGLQYKMFDEVVSVERIEILNSGLRENATWGKYVIISPDSDGIWRYHIKYRVYPDNVSEPRVDFSYDTQNTSVTVDSTGLVVFTAPTTVKIHVIATDGSNVSTTLTIIARKAP